MHDYWVSYIKLIYIRRNFYFFLYFFVQVSLVCTFCFTKLSSLLVCLHNFQISVYLLSSSDCVKVGRFAQVILTFSIQSLMRQFKTLNVNSFSRVDFNYDFRLRLVAVKRYFNNVAKWTLWQRIENLQNIRNINSRWCYYVYISFSLTEP